MPAVYFAAPLFTVAERLFNSALAAALAARLPADLRIVLPQDFDAGTPDASPAWYARMFQHCITGIDRADLVLAVLDGADADSGTCMEVGYAYAAGRPVIGMRTDFRDCEDRGLNLMLSQACVALVLQRDPGHADIDALADQVAAHIRSTLGLPA